MRRQPWFSMRVSLSPGRRRLLALLSFLLPLALWAAISYIPGIWHPYVKITDPGAADFMQVGDLVEKQSFEESNTEAHNEGKAPAKGDPANPVFLPAPHEVFSAFITAFTTPPRRDGDPWLHESLLHSVGIIVWGFFLSSLIGIPLGILCGCFGAVKGLFEPFVEFFRYLPAPAFGALAVAIWGIDDGPKVAIIFIGTFFQQVLVVSNTTRKLDPVLLEAAQTMGVKRIGMLFRVVVPGIFPDLYRDMRILLGWAWTYLIVSEVVGTSTGITWFINQQAKYRIYENVYAAIVMIGIIGILSDMLLAGLGRRLFRWHRLQQKEM